MNALAFVNNGTIGSNCERAEGFTKFISFWKNQITDRNRNVDALDKTCALFGPHSPFGIPRAFFGSLEPQITTSYKFTSIRTPEQDTKGTKQCETQLLHHGKEEEDKQEEEQPQDRE